MKTVARRASLLLTCLTAAVAVSGAPAPGSVLEDSWYVVEMLGQRAGYMHMESREVLHEGQPATRSLMELRNEVSRVNAGRRETVVIKARTVWLEDAQGRSLSMEHLVDQGGGEILTRVRVRGETAEVTVSENGSERTTRVPWKEEVMGPRVLEAKVDDLLAGRRTETTLQTFSFEAGNRVLTVRLRVAERRPDGSTVIEQELLDLDVTVREVYDAEGEMVHQVVGPISMRKTSRQEALAPIEASLEAFEKITVQLDRPLERPRQLRRAAFRLLPRGTGAPPTLAGLFVEDQRQRIERHGATEVLRVEVPPLGKSAVERIDVEPFLLASSLIESDAPEIVRVARERAGDLPPLEAARRLERWVRDNVRYLGSGVGMATARQTLRSRDGDCTENAFLLIALLRAAGIPARLVVGLAYAGEPGGRPVFIPHAWAEGFLGDERLPVGASGIRTGRWIAFDSAVYGERVDATHLAMAKSAGNEEGALVEITIPLLRGLGRFDLAWVE